jgi:hypothetical protein
MKRSLAGLPWKGLNSEEKGLLYGHSSSHEVTGRYLNRLHAAVGVLSPDELCLLSAEALRQAERGDEALAQLGPPPYANRFGTQRHRARVIADLARQGYTHVWYVAGDEDYSPEELLVQIEAGREAVDKARSDRISRWQSVRKEFPAVVAVKQQERKFMEEVAQYQMQFDEAGSASDIPIDVQSAGGIVCPRCHFRYAWDGQRCNHCRHGFTTGATAPANSSGSPMVLQWVSAASRRFVE